MSRRTLSRLSTALCLSLCLALCVPSQSWSQTTPTPNTLTPEQQEIEQILQQGNAALGKGEFAKAQQIYLAGLEKAQSAKNNPSIALFLNNLGKVCYYQGQLEKALDYFQRALAIREKLGDEQDISGSLNNIGAVYHNLGQNEKALDFYQRALKIREKFGNAQNIAASLNNIGGVYEALGQNEKALDFYQRTLAIREKIGNEQEIAASLNNIGNVYNNLGQNEKALDFHQRALPLFEKLGNEQNIAYSLNNIGEVYDTLGQNEKALGFYQRALTLFEKIGNEQDIAKGLTNIGVTYFTLGQSEKALEYHQRALKLCEQIGNEQYIAASLDNIGGDYYALSQYEKALDFYQRALTIREKIGNERDIAGSLNNMGVIYRKQGQLDKAENAFARALHAFEEFTRRVLDPTQLGEAQQTLSRFYERYAETLLQLHRPDDALLKVERGRAQGLSHQIQLNGDNLMGHFTPKDATELQARNAERRAARKLQLAAHNSNLPADAAEHQAFQKRITEADARYHEAENRYALLRDSLFARYPDFQQIQGERQPTIAELKGLSRKKENRDTLYLEYAVVDNETTLRFVLFNGQITASTLPLGEKQLKQMTLDWRKALLGKTSDEPKHARALYTALFSSLPELVQKGTGKNRRGEGEKRRRGKPNYPITQLPNYSITHFPNAQHPTPNTPLVVVANGPLLDIPFAALLDGADKRLCESYAVSSALSLNIFLWRENPMPSTGSLLCVADPMGKQATAPLRVSRLRGGFGPLPSAQAEGRAVAALFPKPTLWIGKEAKKAKVRQEMSQYQVLHFATHGDLDSHNGLRSALVLAPELAGSLEEGFLEGREIVEMGLSANLAVLSACQSGQGQESGGEGLQSLAWAFRAAGVPSVVASQWKVEDEATKTLMVAFYKGLKAGKRKDEALQAAMLLVKKEKPQPFYWAAFQLIGETTPLPPWPAPRR